MVISTTLLTVLNVVDWKMDPQAAVSASRRSTAIVMEAR